MRDDWFLDLARYNDVGSVAVESLEDEWLANWEDQEPITINVVDSGDCLTIMPKTIALRDVVF